jgi:Ca-activated chloride channel family protein
VKHCSIATRVLSAPLIFLLLGCVAISIFPTPTSAQSLASSDVKHDTPGQVIRQGQAVHIDVELALVNITVTDPYNRLVTGLEPDNFRIFEDNVEQEVVNFPSEDIPISVGVILDLSGSISNKVGRAKEAAFQFFKAANPQDEFLLVGFDEHAELLSPFTDNVEDLQSRILPAPAKGRTALLDAIYPGLIEMKGTHKAKRALRIISDGGDNSSRYTDSIFQS